MKWTRLIVALALGLGAALASAQETRATLTGYVADPSGARIPGATITVKDMDTGTVTHAKSNSAGTYTIPFLLPGPYQITVTQAGFKNFTHSGLQLMTEQTVTENVTMSVGNVDESVTVTTEGPLVDTADASTGQTLTAKEVEDLPSNGRSPLGFAHLEYGAVAKGKHAESQTTPFGNQTADDFSLGGGASASNELLLNGVPNMQDSSRTAGFSPELDAVDAVHVDEFSANAAMGDTSGGTVNLTTKSGTNQYHGTASEYYAGSRPLTAKPYFTPAGSTVSSTHYNQFGATIGGPVRVPGLFNGRNRLFFFYSFEGYNGSAPATAITSVPTAAERTGDFSALLAAGTNVSFQNCTKGPKITVNSNQLYNPYTSTADPNCPGQYVRSAIPGNILSNAGLTVNPIAAAYLKLVPLPNYNGASTGADGENNYFASDPTVNNYKSNEGRLDLDVTSRNRLSFEAHESRYVNSQSDVFHNALTGTSSTVILWGGFLEDVHSFSPTLNLDARLGFSRSENTNNPHSLGMSPTSLGFPSYLASNSTLLALPSISMNDSADIPSFSGKFNTQAYFDTIQLFASLNKTWGKHNFKFGPDIRENKNSNVKPGNANGGFSFNAGGGGITYGSAAPTQAFGSSIALFDLGLPTSGSEDISARFQYNNWYDAAFAQDDWKILPNLTVSMGVRFEHETSPVESGNRMIAGFDPTAVNAVSSAAATAYAKSPSALLPTSAFSALGGMYYATSSQRTAYHPAPLYVSPRIGFAYSPDFSHGTLAIRGGFGIYVNPFNDYNFGQAYGYSATTAYTSSLLASGVPTSTLSDPFPSTNPIVQPVGNALGVNTNLGSGAIFYADVKVPYTEKVSLDVEKQFGNSWLVEVGYLGTHAVHLSYSNAISSTPLLPFLSRSPMKDVAVTNALSLQTPNPFYKLLPPGTDTTSLNTKKTISVAQLLQAYPQYSSVTEQLVPGQNASFNAFLFRVTKRMSNGLQFNLNYEHSRLLGAQSQLNPGGPLSYGETTSDFPDHIAFTGVYQLPFGRGRAFLHNSRLADEIVGGWRVSAIYQYLSGTPIQWGNVIYTGNWHDFNNNPHKTTGPSFNTSVFDRISADQPNSYNYRTFPQYVLRSDPNNNWDFSVLKDFHVTERWVVQPRVDAFNALNHPQFNAANVSPTSSSFGIVNKQLNDSRSLQGGIHILF